MREVKALGFLVLIVSVGCGPARFSYDESEALWSASAPAAAPGVLGLLPAKKEPVDPGEVTEELRWRWGFQFGALEGLGDMELFLCTPNFPFRGFLRRGGDRANRIGLEIGFGYVELDAFDVRDESGGVAVDTVARELLLRARGLFGVGPDWLYLTAGAQLVYEHVEWYGEYVDDHFGATLDFGVNFRVARHFEEEITLSLLLGSDNVRAVAEFTMGLIF